MNINAVQNIDLHTTREDSYKTRSQDINILEFTGILMCVADDDPYPFFQRSYDQVLRDNTIVNKYYWKIIKCARYKVYRANIINY